MRVTDDIFEMPLYGINPVFQIQIILYDFVGDYVFCAAWENLSVSDWTEYDAGIYAAPDPAGYPDVCGNL